MAVEHLESIRLVVLAGDRQQHALRAERQQGLLEGHERRTQTGLTQYDALRSVFANDAAPERVVKVDDDHLGSGQEQSPHHPRQGCSESAKSRGGQRAPCKVRHPVIPRSFSAHQAQDRLDVYQTHGTRLLGGMPQSQVQLAH